MSSISATFNTEVSEFIEREMAQIAGAIDWSDCDSYPDDGHTLYEITQRLSTVYLVTFPCSENPNFKFRYDMTNKKVLAYFNTNTASGYVEVGTGGVSRDLSGLSDTKFLAIGRRY